MSSSTRLRASLVPVAIAGCVLLTMTLPACEEKGPMEKAGESLDDAASDLDKAAEDAGEKLDEAAEEAGDAIEDLTDG